MTSGNVLTIPEGYGTDEINAAIAYAAANNKLVEFEPGTYALDGPIVPKSGAHLDGNGCTLVLEAQVNFFDDDAAGATQAATVTADISGPTDTITVDDASGLTVGQRVGIRLGDNEWDTLEPRYAFPALILAIAGNTVQLDHTIPHDIAVTAASNDLNKAVFAIPDAVWNWEMRNFELEGGPEGVLPEGGIRLSYARNITIENVHGNRGTGLNMGSGLVALAQFTKNIQVNDCSVAKNQNPTDRSSHGRGLNFSNCIGVVVADFTATELHTNAVMVESYSEDVTLLRPTVTYSEATVKTGTDVFAVVQDCQITITDPTITTDTLMQQMVGTGGTPGEITINGTFRWTGPLPNFLGDAGSLQCLLEFEDAEGTIVVDFTEVATGSFGEHYGGRDALEALAT